MNSTHTPGQTYGSCAEIVLTNGSVVLVDLADYEWLIQWKWTGSWKGYAIRRTRRRDPATGIVHATVFRMHREILKPPASLQVDHINRNKLDNRRSNLRAVTQSVNQRNMGLRRDNTSGHKGVSWVKSRSRWNSMIRHEGHVYRLGNFVNKDDAIRAYREFEDALIQGMSPPQASSRADEEPRPYRPAGLHAKDHS